MRKIDSSGKAVWRILLSDCADARSRPKGFSTTTRASVGEAGLREALDDRREHARRDREVVQRALRAGEVLLDLLERAGVVVVAVDVLELLDELREGRLVEAAVLRDARARALDELLARPAGLRDADDRHVEPPAARPSTAARGRSSCRRGRPSRRRRPARRRVQAGRCSWREAYREDVRRENGQRAIRETDPWHALLSCAPSCSRCSSPAAAATPPRDPLPRLSTCPCPCPCPCPILPSRPRPPPRPRSPLLPSPPTGASRA